MDFISRFIIDYAPDSLRNQSIRFHYSEKPWRVIPLDKQAFQVNCILFISTDMLFFEYLKLLGR